MFSINQKSIFLKSVTVIRLSRIQSDLFIILLQGSDVLPGLSELSLLHAFPDVPVDEGPLGVHQVELVVQPGPSLAYRGVKKTENIVSMLPIAVVLDNMQTALGILAMSPPGTTVGG